MASVNTKQTLPTCKDDATTFVINEAALAQGSSHHPSHFPFQSSGLDSMFTPLQLERMFQQSPSDSASDNEPCDIDAKSLAGATSSSIAGMLWQRRGAGNDASFTVKDNTLRQLLANGTGAAACNQRQTQLQPTGPVTPVSPKDMYIRMGTSSSSSSSSAAQLPKLNTTHSNTSTPHLPISTLSSSTSLSRAPSTRTSTGVEHAHPRSLQNQHQHYHLSNFQPQQYSQATNQLRYDAMSARNAPEPFPSMNPISPPPHIAHPPLPKSNTGSALRGLHESTAGPVSLRPVSRAPTSVALRQGILEKAARRSLIRDPFSGSAPAGSNSPTEANPANAAKISAVHDTPAALPGGRPRAYTWASVDESGVPPTVSGRSDKSKLNKIRCAGSNSSSRSHMHTPESLGNGGAEALMSGRKSSDSSAHILITPRDFNIPLPERVGDMVLDKDIGEWVRVATPSPKLENACLAMTPSDSPFALSPSVPATAPPISHAAPFPQPLPVEDEDEATGCNTRPRRGSHCSSDVQWPAELRVHQREVKEMIERRSGVIEDAALGTIVHKLESNGMDNAKSGYAHMNLSGSGIRSLNGLGHLASHLEGIDLSCNKLTSLRGLPMGIVTLIAKSNWIADNANFDFSHSLPHLEFVDMSNNEISDIKMFSNLRHLRTLVLNRNRISSLKDLKGCRRLTKLSLRENAITNFDLSPDEVRRLSVLDLYNNRIRALPWFISEFPEIHTINLAENDLELVELNHPAVSSLKELKLSRNPRILRHCDSTLDISAWSLKFPNLRTLYLDECNVKHVLKPSSNYHTYSDFNSCAPHWSSLFNLSIRGYVTQPQLTVDLSCLRSLKNLYAPDTQLMLPRTLPILPHLKQLVLVNSGITRLPTNMGAALPSLKVLDVSNNTDLIEFMPILQLSGLEVLRCRAVGFGGLAAIQVSSGTKESSEEKELEAFPDIKDVDSMASMSSSSSSHTLGESGGSLGETSLLKWFSKLHKLRELDLRFNQCTNQMYASAAGCVVSSVNAADSFSPTSCPNSVPSSPRISEVPAIAAQGDQRGVVPARFDEQLWLKSDSLYLANMKASSSRSRLLRRRETYWASAASLFPRLERLDGIRIELR